MNTGPSMFERLGGELVLRAAVSDFVDNMIDDDMIGFLFGDVSPARLKQLEYEYAAEYLGGPVRYRGRALGKVHAKHEISGGQFARRSALLRNVLERHRIPEDICDAWLAHTESLRSTVINDSGEERKV